MPPQSPPPQPVPPPPQAPQGDYEFIFNPAKPPRRSIFSGLSGSSLGLKVIYILGGLLVLVIILSIVRSVFGRTDMTAFITVAQDQQAIIHLDAGTSEQQNISVSNKNFALTSQLSLTSSQSTLIQYLAKNGHKVSPKVLVLKVSPSTDQELVNAAAATTYDQTFKQVMNAKLTTYMNDLRKAYPLSPGPKGKALLSDDYKQAQLLQAQLNGPAQ